MRCARSLGAAGWTGGTAPADAARWPGAAADRPDPDHGMAGDWDRPRFVR